MCPLRCQGALVVVPNHALRRMVQVLAPSNRSGHRIAERAHSTILSHDDAAGGIFPALRRARSSLKRPASEAHVTGADAVPACINLSSRRLEGKFLLLATLEADHTVRMLSSCTAALTKSLASPALRLAAD